MMDLTCVTADQSTATQLANAERSASAESRRRESGRRVVSSNVAVRAGFARIDSRYREAERPIESGDVAVQGGDARIKPSHTGTGSEIQSF